MAEKPGGDFRRWLEDCMLPLIVTLSAIGALTVLKIEVIGWRLFYGVLCFIAILWAAYVWFVAKREERSVLENVPSKHVFQYDRISRICAIIWITVAIVLAVLDFTIGLDRLGKPAAPESTVTSEEISKTANRIRDWKPGEEVSLNEFVDLANRITPNHRQEGIAWFLSPDRGRLLSALIISPMDDETKKNFMVNANFSCAYLPRGHRLLPNATFDTSEMDLSDAVLQRAYLPGVVLTDATLIRCFLRNAVLPEAQLDGADLRGADLKGASLRGANLRRSVLAGLATNGGYLYAYLDGADLTDADLSGAVVYGEIWNELLASRDRPHGIDASNWRLVPDPAAEGIYRLRRR